MTYESNTPDTAKSTPLPDSAYRITSHEILALLSFNSGPEIDLSRKALGLAELPEDSDLVRAGVGTLNIRGSIRREGEDIALQGDAEVIARILASAQSWYQVARLGPAAALPTYVVESPGAKAAFFLQPLSEYICLPLRDDIDLPAFVEQLVDGAVTEAQAAGAGVITSQHWTPGADPVVANIKVADGAPALLAALPLSADGQLTVREIGDTTAGAAVVAAFRSTP